LFQVERAVKSLHGAFYLQNKVARCEWLPYVSELHRRTSNLECFFRSISGLVVIVLLVQTCFCWLNSAV
jgi:hypothetical protein